MALLIFCCAEGHFIHHFWHLWSQHRRRIKPNSSGLGLLSCCSSPCWQKFNPPERIRPHLIGYLRIVFLLPCIAALVYDTKKQARARQNWRARPALIDKADSHRITSQDQAVPARATTAGTAAFHAGNASLSTNPTTARPRATVLRASNYQQPASTRDGNTGPDTYAVG